MNANGFFCYICGGTAVKLVTVTTCSRNQTASVGERNLSDSVM